MGTAAQINAQFEALQSFLTVAILLMARFGAFVATVPFLGQLIPSGLVRTCVVAAFALPVFPYVHWQYLEIAPTLTNSGIMLLVLKEALIGIVLAIVLGAFTFGLMAAGFFLDFQRGAGMAEVIAPGSGEQTSTTSVLLLHMYITILFSTGGFLTVLGLMYSSYQVWGVFETLPELSGDFVAHSLHLLDDIMKVLLVLFAPIVIVLFLVELTLAVYSRFNTQLNVTIVAMPIKSGLMFIILLLMMPFVVRYMTESVAFFPDLFNRLKEVFQ